MKYLIVPELDDLTDTLTKSDLGDLIINGRIEAYSCKRAGRDKRTAKSLEKHYKTIVGSSRTPSSPLGPLALPSTRKLLISLITTMNNSFPDYDFSELQPDQFTEKKVTAVISTLNSLFLDSMDRVVSGFRAKFWKVLDEVIETEKSQVFTYTPGFGVSAGTLWSTNFFFYNKNLKKIVFLMISGASKLALVSQEREEESDVEMAEMEDDETITPQKKSAPVKSYVDFDLIDMEDLGLDSIDIPPSTWVSSDGSEFSETAQDHKSDTSSSYSRSMFSNTHITPPTSYPSSPFFVESGKLSGDISSIFSPPRG